MSKHRHGRESPRKRARELQRYLKRQDEAPDRQRRERRTGGERRQ